MEPSTTGKTSWLAKRLPVLMVVLGVVCGLLAGLLGANEFYFNAFRVNMINLGVHLIQWGAILLGVGFICTAFGRKQA